MSKNKEISDEKSAPELILAQSSDAKRSAPMLQLLSAVAYLGIFSSLVGAYMIVMSSFSGNESGLIKKAMPAAVLIFAVCVAAVFVFRFLDKRNRAAFEEKEREKLNSSPCFDGEVKKIKKHIRHVSYSHEVFDEITWRFVIEYTDSETGEVCTADSDAYLNDISDILADSGVKVHKLSDGALIFDGYKLKKSFKDKGVSFEVDEESEDAAV